MQQLASNRSRINNMYGLLLTVSILTIAFSISAESQELGIPCSIDEDCHNTETGLFCDHVTFDGDGKCNCPAETFYNQATDHCISFAGHNCNAGSNCIDNSTCINDICKCNEDYIIEPTGGICLLRYDALCDESWPCSQDSGLECPQPQDAFAPRQCKCKFENEYYAWSKDSEKCVALIGTECRQSEECADGAVCDENNFCRCSDSHLLTYNKKCMQPIISDELSCNETLKEYCKIFDYFKCLTGNCDCDFPVQLWKSKDTKEKCRREIGEDCGLSDRAGRIFPCIENAECVGFGWQSGVGTCQCAEGMRQTEDNECSSISNSRSKTHNNHNSATHMTLNAPLAHAILLLWMFLFITSAAAAKNPMASFLPDN